MPRSALSGSEVEAYRTNEVWTPITMYVGTIETKIQAKREASPCRVASLAVKALLEAWLAIVRVAAVFGFRTLFPFCFEDLRYLIPSLPS
jgi:hypothetical protein